MAEHAKQVASLASTHAGKFGAASLGEMAGLLHDLGKYSDEFQRKLRGVKLRVDHSTAGARVAAEAYAGNHQLGRLLAYVIAGHHAGLANGAGNGERSALLERLDAKKHPVPALPSWSHDIILPVTVDVPPHQPHPDTAVRTIRRGLCFSALTRMLFSALVDADRLDTEEFYARAAGCPLPARGNWQPLGVLKHRLDQFMADKAARAAQEVAADGQRLVNRGRATVLAAARAKASLAPGLFSLSVPTGGGKTLASLTFALDHAVQYGLDRVIYVIPFTSIIEQTAKVFREALGPELADHILEHHSAFREEEALKAMQEELGASGDESSLQDGTRIRLATENWDVPIIVTTSVQFFESLFSNRTSQCRKLHNIARSVVILDEAQTLPVTLLMPCVAMIDELARNYRASIVLCTATQPALAAERPDGAPGLAGGLSGVREIVDEPEQLYKSMQRVTVRIPDGKITDEQLVERLRQHEKVLCIVGTRPHARDLFLALQPDRPDSTFHLSALMCPAHRSLRLAEIKAALKNGPCRVVATTVVEAGVDIDFPIVYRAMAGLDSIAQAAGRCNREGKRDRFDSIVQLFEIDGRKPIRELCANEETARKVLEGRCGGDPLSPKAIEAYFDELYWRKSQGRDSGLDASRHWPDKKVGSILAKLNERASEGVLPFEDVAKAFRMIDSAMEPVIIPFGDEARGLIAELGTTNDVRCVARKLQPYIVNIPLDKFAALRAAGRIQPAHPDRFEDQFMRLTAEAYPSHYHDAFGLDWNDPTKRASKDNLI